MAVRKVSWVMQFKDRATSQVKKVDKAVDGATSKVKTLSESLKGLSKNDGLYQMGDNLTGLASQLKGVGLAAGAFTGLAIKSNTDFNKGLSETQANLQATNEEMAEIEKHIKTMDKMGSNTSMAQMASVYASAGFDKEQITGMLAPSDLLTSMGIDEGITADIMATGILQYQIDPDSSESIADMMATGRALAKQEIDDIGALASAFSGSAKQMNMDLADVTTMSAIMADGNLRGAEAGTALNAVYRDLIGNMEDGAIQVGKTKVAVANSDGSLRTMQDILMDITDETENLTDEQRALALANVFGANSMKAVNAFVGQGTEKYKEYEQAVMGSEGAAKEMSATLNDNLAGDSMIMKGLASDVMGDIGEGVSGVARVITKGAISVLKVIKGMPQPVKSAIGIMTGSLATLVTGLAAVGGVLKGAAIIKTLVQFVGIGSKLGGIVGGVATAFKGLGAFFAANPIVLGIMGMIGAGVLLYRNWDTIKEKASALKSNIQEKWSSFKDWAANNSIMQMVASSILTRVEGIKSIVSGAIGFVKNVIEGDWRGAWDNAVGIIEGFMGFMGKIPSRLFEIGREMVSSFAESVKDFGVGIGGKVKGFFGFGTEGKSHRTGKDKVPYDGYPATLHKGEMVLQRPVAELFRKLGGTERSLPNIEVNRGQVLSFITDQIDKLSSSKDLAGPNITNTTNNSNIYNTEHEDITDYAGDIKNISNVYNNHRNYSILNADDELLDIFGGIGEKIKSIFSFKDKNKDRNSHRSGKDKIPYDGYQATLHKDEMVLQKSVADKFRKLGGTERTLPSDNEKKVNVSLGGIHITVKEPTSTENARQQGKTIGKEIREEIDKYFRNMGIVF